jgi:hypothetical protein
MNTLHTLKTIRKKLITGLVWCVQTQCTVLLVAFPFLVSWGLPISIMAVVGNILFAPFLTIFLLVSSLLFFTEILGIPNGLFLIILNNLSSFWQTLLTYGKNTWLVGFIKPPLYLLAPLSIFSCIAVYWLHHKTSYSSLRVIVLIFSLNLGIVYLYPRWFQSSAKKNSQAFDKNLEIIYHPQDATLTLIDNDFFRRKRNIPNCIKFELKPYLLKTFGTISFRNIILRKAGAGSFQATLELSKLCPTKRVILPFFKNSLSRYGWYSFFTLKRQLAEMNIPFIRKNIFTYKKDPLHQNGRDTKTIDVKNRQRYPL